jgi:hypothetical protein
MTPCTSLSGRTQTRHLSTNRRTLSHRHCAVRAPAFGTPPGPLRECEAETVVRLKNAKPRLIGRGSRCAARRYAAPQLNLKFSPRLKTNSLCLHHVASSMCSTVTPLLWPALSCRFVSSISRCTVTTLVPVKAGIFSMQISWILNSQDLLEKNPEPAFDGTLPPECPACVNFTWVNADAIIPTG